MEGRIDWDASKPNGQDYRAYDLSRLTALGFRSEVSLEQGLTKTWQWYCAEQQHGGKADA
jgi:GDP-L-fucose synthase